MSDHHTFKLPLSKRSQRVLGDILETLGDKTMTAWQIHERSGWSHPTVSKYLNYMMATGQVHIPGWQNHVVMLWTAGPGHNAGRPPKTTAEQHKERCRNWRRRNREHCINYQLQRNKNTKQVRAAKAAARAQSALAGMWGPLAISDTRLDV